MAPLVSPHLESTSDATSMILRDEEPNEYPEDSLEYRKSPDTFELASIHVQSTAGMGQVTRRGYISREGSKLGTARFFK